MRSWMIVLVSCCVGSACMAQEFEITAVEKDGTIRWQVLDGHVYTVESCDGLTVPWEAVAPDYRWPVLPAQCRVVVGGGWPAGSPRFLPPPWIRS